MGKNKKLTLYIYIYIYSFLYIYIYSHNKSIDLKKKKKKKKLIGWQLNGFHSCLIGEKKSHRLEGSLNYYQIEFDGMVNGKLKSQEMLIERERERENRKWKQIWLDGVIDGKLKNV